MRKGRGKFEEERKELPLRELNLNRFLQFRLAQSFSKSSMANEVPTSMPLFFGLVIGRSSKCIR